MNWFLIALISPIANAFVNHFDKYLIARFIKGSGVGSLILFSALFSVVLLPILYFINTDLFTGVNLVRAVVLILSGCILTLAILFYLYALQDEEASIIVALSQLVPVFGFIFSYFILGETISNREIIAAGLIIVGGSILSVEYSGWKSQFKWKMALLMIFATYCYALSIVMFKAASLNENFIDSLFWTMLGKVVFGIVLFFGVKHYRYQFLQLLKSNRNAIIGLNVLNEIIGLVAEVSLVFAVLLAPVFLVQSVSGLQPLFVFIFGVVLTLLFPKFVNESLQKKDLIQKILGIIVVTIGVYLLGFSI